MRRLSLAEVDECSANRARACAVNGGSSGFELKRPFLS